MRKRRQFFFSSEKMAKMRGTNDRRSIDRRIRAEKKNGRDERDEELNPKGQHANTTRFLSIKVVVLPYGLYVERDVRTFSLSLSLRSRAARSVQSIHVLLRASNLGCAIFFFFFFIFLFFLSLAKLDKWNFEQNRICNCLSSLSRSTRIEIVSIKETISLVIYVEISVGGIYIYVCMYMYVYITYANTIVYNV